MPFCNFVGHACLASFEKRRTWHKFNVYYEVMHLQFCNRMESQKWNQSCIKDPEINKVKQFDYFLTKYFYFSKEHIFCYV